MNGLGFEIKIDVQVENNRFIWRLPKACKDITMNWRDAFDLGDLIGQNAFVMEPRPSDPGQDEAIADQVRLGRHSQEFMVFYFPEEIVEFNWSREVALVVAEKICKLAESIAEELVDAGKVVNKQ